MKLSKFILTIFSLMVVIASTIGISTILSSMAE